MTGIKLEVGKSYETTGAGYTVKMLSKDVKGNWIAEAFHSGGTVVSFLFAYDNEGNYKGWLDTTLGGSLHGFPIGSKLNHYNIKPPEPPKPIIFARRMSAQGPESCSTRIGSYSHRYDEENIGMFIYQGEDDKTGKFYSNAELKNTIYWGMYK